MKLFKQGGHRERGSVLVITLGLAVILGTTLGGYLYWVRTQHLLVAESQGWNSALSIAEAGIEEGLAQANVGFGTNYLPSIQTNWSHALLGGGPYGPRTNGVANGFYSVILIPINPGPTIISTGTVQIPFTSKRLVRTVMVTTTNVPAFGYAMMVKTNVTTKGNNLTVDSYDSSDPYYSTNGVYDASTRKAGGDIASTGGIINIQNADIFGKLKTGPSGSYSIGNGSVGDLNWNVVGQIQPGWYANDFNMDFRDVQPPYTSGIDPTLPSTKVNLGTNTYVLLGGASYYYNGDFVLNQNETLYVSGTNTVLYVTGNFNMKSQNACYISLAPGASLTLYVGTTSGSAVSGNLTQVNTSGNAGSFSYYGLPSNNSLVWSGNNNFVGTIYAPEADVSLGGGGSTVLDYQGSIVANSASLNGHFNVHYDESLRNGGPQVSFTVTSWQEL
jgi:hypothetical protein